MRSPCRCPVHSASNSGRCRCGAACRRKGGLVVGSPDFVASRYAMEATTTGAGIDQHESTVERPRQYAGEHGPTIISNSTAAACGYAVAPRHEDAARAPVGQRRQREVAKLVLDALDVPDIALARDLGEAEELGAQLVTLHHRQERAAWRHHLARDRLVVAVDEFRRSWLAAQRRPALPCIPIGPLASVGERLGDRVNSFESYPHVLQSIDRVRCLAARLC